MILYFIRVSQNITTAKYDEHLFLFAHRHFFFLPRRFSTAIFTSFTNLSLPLDGSDLECPLPLQELGLPSQCKYKEDGSRYITSCGPMDRFTGKSVDKLAINVVWTHLILSDKKSN